MPGADLDRAVAHYAQLAPRYDHFTRRIDAIRRRAIDALQLRAGDVVVDAGCGTGWAIPALARLVGASGRVIGFDPSPEMLAIARTRTAACKVELVCAPCAQVVLPAPADAVLFSYTHDLIRSPPALENLIRQLKPGARVAATSTKLYASWLFPANWYLRWTHRAYITDFESFDAPWSLLEEYLDDFTVETGHFTQHYVATGRVRALSAQRA
jgi:ubiquinone/menaquinone biosynthesis C-methylase UbiE